MIGAGLLVLFIVLLVLGIYLMSTTSTMVNRARASDRELLALWLIVPSVIFGIVLGITTLAVYSNQISDLSKVEEYQARIDIAVERQGQIDSILRAELSNYPEFEQEVYENFLENSDPSILFRYPELRSNIVVIEAAERYTDAVDQIYTEQRDLESVYRDIRTRESNTLAPKFWGFPYREESN